jgi:predicted SnoaL-like aldol condensation-catalyzing enzyme
MDIRKNKENAVNFYKMSYEGAPRKAAELYVGNEYIQHNPSVENGVEPFVVYFEKAGREHPNKLIEFVRVIGEGDLVALHTHQTWPDIKKEYVTMDFFRFDANGKIVEHWDAIQQIPPTSANGNTMY